METDPKMYKNLSRIFTMMTGHEMPEFNHESLLWWLDRYGIDIRHDSGRPGYDRDITDVPGDRGIVLTHGGDDIISVGWMGDRTVTVYAAFMAAVNFIDDEYHISDCMTYEQSLNYRRLYGDFGSPHELGWINGFLIPVRKDWIYMSGDCPAPKSSTLSVIDKAYANRKD